MQHTHYVAELRGNPSIIAHWTGSYFFASERDGLQITAPEMIPTVYHHETRDLCVMHFEDDVSLIVNVLSIFVFVVLVGICWFSASFVCFWQKTIPSLFIIPSFWSILITPFILLLPLLLSPYPPNTGRCRSHGGARSESQTEAVGRGEHGSASGHGELWWGCLVVNSFVCCVWNHLLLASLVVHGRCTRQFREAIAQAALSAWGGQLSVQWQRAIQLVDVEIRLSQALSGVREGRAPPCDAFTETIWSSGIKSNRFENLFAVILCGVHLSLCHLVLFPSFFSLFSLPSQTLQFHGHVLPPQLQSTELDLRKPVPRIVNGERSMFGLSVVDCVLC